MEITQKELKQTVETKLQEHGFSAQVTITNIFVDYRKGTQKLLAAVKVNNDIFVGIGDSINALVADILKGITNPVPDSEKEYHKIEE